MDERDSPVCHVLVAMGFYGFVCGGNVPTGLAVCVGVYQQAVMDFAATGDPGPLLATLNQQITPGHQPNLGAQYQPDDERIFCNAFLWTIDMLGQPGTCIR